MRHLFVGSIITFVVLVTHGSSALATPLESPLLAASTNSAYVLITDVDDTIKVSHIIATVSTVVRFLSDPVSFAGMSTLYGSMLDESKSRGQTSGFVVLSGTPQLFESTLWDFLEVFKFPEPLRLFSRPFLLNTEEYKTEAVTKFIGTSDLADATVILIGDDTESDLAAYQNALNLTTFGTKTAQRRTQIYIRRVSGDATTLVQTVPNAVAFDSAADIAIWEFAAGRLSRTAVEKVFSEVEKEKDFQRLFVPEEYCPTRRSARLSDRIRVDLVSSTQVPADLLKRFVRLEDHLRERCQSLNAWIAGLLE